MAPFDLPHVTHDMMLRFMNVNFSSIYSEGTARIPSSLGSSPSGVKPLFVPSAAVPTATNVAQGKTPEQEKAMWEAYYNAGSAALVLVLIFAAVGAWVWWIKRRRGQGKGGLHLPTSLRGEEEEHIPLNPAGVERSGLSSAREVSENGNGHSSLTRAASLKGKEREVVSSSEAIFDVGDSDEDDEDVADKRRTGGVRPV